MTSERMHEASAPGEAVWRRMREEDLPAVCAIAARVHSGYPEEDVVFAERLRLYPAGCRILELDGLAAGYALSHPWVLGRPPRLNSLLGGLPTDPATLHLHDVALLPAARGVGAASRLIGRLAELARAAGLSHLSLVAVNDSAAFWESQGFGVVRDPALERELHGYGPAACFMVRSLP